MATEVRSPAPQDQLGAVLAGRDGVVQVWDTAALLARAVEAVTRG